MKWNSIIRLDENACSGKKFTSLKSVWMETNLKEFQLTNRFHVAVCLFINRSQMTSKCGKNKKVALEAMAVSVTDVLTTF